MKIKQKTIVAAGMIFLCVCFEIIVWLQGDVRSFLIVNGIFFTTLFFLFIMMTDLDKVWVIGEK